MTSLRFAIFLFVPALLAGCATTRPSAGPTAMTLSSVTWKSGHLTSEQLELGEIAVLPTVGEEGLAASAADEIFLALERRRICSGLVTPKDASTRLGGSDVDLEAFEEVGAVLRTRFLFASRVHHAPRGISLHGMLFDTATGQVVWAGESLGPVTRSAAWELVHLVGKSSLESAVPPKVVIPPAARPHKTSDGALFALEILGEALKAANEQGAFGR